MREPITEVSSFSQSQSQPQPPEALLEKFKDYGQEDAFSLWNELSSDERLLVIKGIESLHLSRIHRIIRCSLRPHGLPASSSAIETVPESCVSTVEERTPQDKERWWNMGLKAISEGKLGVLLLSGGQGTRPGSSDPKGCFNIALPSGKSLFQLQAERISCLQGLAGSVQIHWYIMTSSFTNDAPRKFFQSHNYFGLVADQVTVFQQGTVPCVFKDGRFIMETPFNVLEEELSRLLWLTMLFH